MEKFDPEMEQRVWKRVRGEEQPQPQPPTGLQGPEKSMLRKIFEQEKSHAAILRGMHTVMTGQPISSRTLPPEPQAPEMALRKCYARKLKTLSEYESRTNDKEYGAAFAHLAQQEREHCAVILQLLGSMSR